MGSRRVFPLSVDTAASSTNVNRSQPPPPKSPVHRSTGNGSINEIARPPTGGSVGYIGLDRLMMMRQVNAAAPTTIQFGNGGDEVSAAVNHRQRMAAEHQRRLETVLMEKEDYTGTPEGQERLQRQEERSRMREEELLVLRFVEMEKEAARMLQREKELEEEKRVKEQYLAKIRAQREQQEKEAKEKEAARKAEMERKMKALKEAADAKARAEFAEKQHAIEEEARLAREKHQIEVENVQMQVEDVLGHGMQQEMIIERERQRQIAAEQDKWRLFQEREQEKQRDAAQLRRAAMAQQYEQDKQRRIQIHKLQKERAAQQAERREMHNRQVQKHKIQQEVKPENDTVSMSGDASIPMVQDEDNSSVVAVVNVCNDVTQDELQEENAMPQDISATDLVTETENTGVNTLKLAGNDDRDDTRKNVHSIGPFWFSSAKPKVSASKNEGETQMENTSSSDDVQGETNCVEQEVQGPRDCDIPDDACSSDKVGEVALGADLTKAEDGIPKDNENADNKKIEQDLKSATDESVSDANVKPIADLETSDGVLLVLSISAARKQGLTPFAQVLSVADNSPAMQATLRSGDLLVEFGGIVSSTPKCLMEMADCVQKNVNNAIPVVLLRPVGTTSEENFEEVRVSLCPHKWKGKGLLGCQLSPYRWSIEEDIPQKPNENEASTAQVEETPSIDDGATALVVYDIVPASVADQAGLLNGDILAGCDGLEDSVNVANLSLVVDHIQAKRSARMPVHLDINRWIDEDQCYRSLRVELSSGEDPSPLGFALTSFAEYYNYYTSSTAVVSACQECYYTPLTTALHAAALSGHVSCLEALLNSLQNGDGGGYSASDYLDWRDEDGRTPLFYACYAGQVECVRYLLKIMQSVSTEQQPFVSAGVDLYGDTVLHAASTSGNVAVVALLLESGCVKVDDRNHTRLTCAHVAPNVEILTFLGEQSDADLLATDAEERMPLAYACLRNDIESIQYLCRKHPDFVDYADIRGNTSLHVAAWLGLQQAAEVLITFLPSIALFITNEDGQNAAELARSSGMECVAAFLESAIAAADSSVA